MADKRLKKGKGIRVRHWNEEGEVVSAYRLNGVRYYEIRIGPAHFVSLPRKEFELLDFIIKFDTLKKLRETENYW